MLIKPKRTILRNQVTSCLQTSLPLKLHFMRASDKWKKPRRNTTMPNKSQKDRTLTQEWVSLMQAMVLRFWDARIPKVKSSTCDRQCRCTSRYLSMMIRTVLAPWASQMCLMNTIRLTKRTRSTNCSSIVNLTHRLVSTQGSTRLTLLCGTITSTWQSTFTRRH